jgi:hypothetical protein
MFESLGFGKKVSSQNPSIPEREIPKKSEEELDAEIINEAEKEHYEKKSKEVSEEFIKLQTEMRRQQTESREIIDFIYDDCILKNIQDLDEEMSLKDFFDFIKENEINFNLRTRRIINSWISTYYEKIKAQESSEEKDPDEFLEEINSKISLGKFLKFVKDKNHEANFLLSPGPEEKSTSNNESTDDEIEGHPF